jgi:hypothetical protein
MVLLLWVVIPISWIGYYHYRERHRKCYGKRYCQRYRAMASATADSNPLSDSGVGQMNYRRAERRHQSRIVERTKDVEREDLWRFVMTRDLLSLSIDNRLY